MKNENLQLIEVEIKGDPVVTGIVNPVYENGDILFFVSVTKEKREGVISIKENPHFKFVEGIYFLKEIPNFNNIKCCYEIEREVPRI